MTFLRAHSVGEGGLLLAPLLALASMRHETRYNASSSSSSSSSSFAVMFSSVGIGGKRKKSVQILSEQFENFSRRHLNFGTLGREENFPSLLWERVSSSPLFCHFLAEDFSAHWPRKRRREVSGSKTLLAHSFQARRTKQGPSSNVERGGKRMLPASRY